MLLMYLSGGALRSPRFVCASLIAGISLLLASPQGAARAQSETLTAECTQFSEVVNQNQQIMADFEAELTTFSQSATQAETLDEIKSAAKQYVDAVNGVADNLEGLVSDLSALPLSDEQLLSYRDQYSTVVAGFNGALAIAAEAMNGVAETESEEELAGRIETLQTDTVGAVEQIQQLATQETDIIQNVNAHCGTTAAE